MRWQCPVRGNHSEIFESGKCSCSFTLGMHVLNLSSSVVDILDTVLMNKHFLNYITSFSLLLPLHTSCFSRQKKFTLLGSPPQTESEVLFLISEVTATVLEQLIQKRAPRPPCGKIIARQTALADLWPLVQNRIPLWE